MATSKDTAIQDYYRERAPVYDEVYAYPERQADVTQLQEIIPALLADQQLLEVAAGTGYWTQYIAPVVKHHTAIDFTPQALARLEQRPACKSVETLVLDAYQLQTLEPVYTALFAGLWLSHVPRQRLPKFLASVHKLLPDNAPIVFLDNSSAQCQRLPITETDGQGNTYQQRPLKNGSIHRVLKNFPTEAQLLEATQGWSREGVFLELENFWLFHCRNRK